MMRIRSAILIAACRSHAWVGAHLLQAQEPGGFDEVTLELAAAGVREVRSVFPDLASMPVPVVEWLAGGGGVTLGGGNYPQGGGSAGGSREDYARGSRYLEELARNTAHFGMEF